MQWTLGLFGIVVHSSCYETGSNAQSFIVPILFKFVWYVDLSFIAYCLTSFGMKFSRVNFNVLQATSLLARMVEYLFICKTHFEFALFVSSAKKTNFVFRNLSSLSRKLRYESVALPITHRIQGNIATVAVFARVLLDLGLYNIASTH